MVAPSRILSMLVFICAIPQSYAALIDLQIQGFVQSNEDGITGVEIMDAITATIRLDSSSQPVFVNQSNVLWTNVENDANFALNDFTASLDPAPNGLSLTRIVRSIQNDATSFELILSVASNVINGWQASSFSFVATDLDGVAFSEQVFPTSLDGVDSAIGGLSFVNELGESSTVGLSFTSWALVPVPIPGAVLLLLSAISSISMLGRSSR